VIDDEARAKVAKVVEFAHTHLYQPRVSGPAPGEVPELVAELNSFHCVFSFTVDDQGNLHRHLSISVPGEHFPHPILVAEIAGLYGFTGWEAGLEAQVKSGAWRANVNRHDHCVALAEQMV
jgi:hypothetical protein